MTVGELIEKLKQHDGEEPVMLLAGNRFFYADDTGAGIVRNGDGRIVPVVAAKAARIDGDRIALIISL